jgi:hypothetical protein
MIIGFVISAFKTEGVTAASATPAAACFKNDLLKFSLFSICLLFKV